MSNFNQQLASSSIWADPAVANHLNRITSTDTTIKNHLAALILGLKKDGLWDKIDVVCVAHDVEADSLLNLKGSASGSVDSAKDGTPTFTANQGFTCDDAGADSISMNLTETSATLYNQHDAHAFVYTRTFTPSTNWFVMGISSGANNIRVVETTTDEVIFAFQDGVATTVVQNDPIGFMGMSIQSTTDRHFRLNDTPASDTASQTSTLATSTIYIGAGTNGGSPRSDEQVAAWGIGGGLTSTELGLYEDRIKFYLTARGTNVF